MSTTRIGQRSRTDELLLPLDTITASIVLRQSRFDDGSMSIPDQQTAAIEWCAKQTPPVNVGPIYVERDVSGRKPLDKRKGLKAAVEDVERGDSQMLLTVYFDRFVRSVATRAEVVQRVEKKDGVVMTMDFGRTSNATAVDKLSGTLLAAIAEFYADQVGEKLTVTKQRNIDRGVPPFPRITPAYVRREDGTLEPHPVNAPLVREAIKMRLRGESYATLTKWLNEQGLTISSSGVESMLSSRLLIGEIHFGDFKPNLHAGDNWGGVITDRTTFARLQKMRVSRGRYAKSERLLARQNVLICGTCDSRLTVRSTRDSKSGKRYYFYGCGNPLCEHKASITAPAVEQYVSEIAIKMSASYEGHASNEQDVEEARLAVDDLDQRIRSTIETLAIVGLDAHAAARDTLTALHAEHDVAEARYQRLLALTTPTMTVHTDVDWNALTLDEQRGVIHATIACAVVNPSANGRGTRVVDLTRVVIEPREPFTLPSK